MPSPVPILTNVRRKSTDQLIAVIVGKGQQITDDTLMVNGVVIEFQYEIVLEVIDTFETTQGD